MNLNQKIILKIAERIKFSKTSTRFLILSTSSAQNSLDRRFQPDWEFVVAQVCHLPTGVITLVGHHIIFSGVSVLVKWFLSIWYFLSLFFSLTHVTLITWQPTEVTALVKVLHNSKFVAMRIHTNRWQMIPVYLVSLSLTHTRPSLRGSQLKLPHLSMYYVSMQIYTSGWYKIPVYLMSLSLAFSLSLSLPLHSHRIAPDIWRHGTCFSTVWHVCVCVCVCVCVYTYT